MAGITQYSHYGLDDLRIAFRFMRVQEIFLFS